MRLKPGKERLDKLMVVRGLVETRTKAQALILAGQVFSKEQRLEKAGLEVSVDIELTIREPLPYVSRGGLKLAAALDHFQVDVQDSICLDIGASTGGFTDCLLQRGARRVVALDVGHGQIDWKLRQDPRVEVRENVNDVSFISLTRILPAVPGLIRPGATIINLIKPQFEVGREEVGRGGIVRDETAQLRVVSEISRFVETLGWHCIGVIDSPIFGADGNREFLGCFMSPE